MSKDYATSELAVRRRIAQNTLKKEIRFMKAAQIIHDRASVKYRSALSAYNKLDLAYAMKHKFTICKAKKAKSTRVRKVQKNIMSKKLRGLLNGLPPEAVTRIITAYEDK